METDATPKVVTGKISHFQPYEQIGDLDHGRDLRFTVIQAWAAILYANACFVKPECKHASSTKSWTPNPSVMPIVVKLMQARPRIRFWMPSGTPITQLDLEME